MKRLAIYGIGRSFDVAIFSLFQDGHFFEFWEEVIYLVDNDMRKSGNSVCGKTVVHPTQVNFADIDMVLIATELFFDDSLQILTRQYGVNTCSILSLQEHLRNTVWTAKDNIPFITAPAEEFDFVARDLARGLTDPDNYGGSCWHDGGVEKEEYLGNIAVRVSNMLSRHLSDAESKYIGDGKSPRFTAFCDICQEYVPMTIFQSAWSGAVEWTQSVTCDNCKTIPRHRAVVNFLRNIAQADPQTSEIYIAEQVTGFYSEFSKLYRCVTGSEFLNPAYTGGKTYPFKDQMIRHEDLTKLSFPDSRFDFVITQNVFEHIGNYEAAFRECLRVLKDNGKLIFTVPFHYLQDKTLVRAYTDDRGEVIHLSPPEIHGDPLSGGSLCFQNFGWDILDSLKSCGFSNVKVNVCWGPGNGYMKAINVFSADKLGLTE